MYRFTATPTIVIFVLLICHNLAAQDSAINVEDVRTELFYNDFTDEQIKPLHEKLEALNQPEPLLQAYQGLILSMMDKIDGSPGKKLKRLSEARELIKESTEAQPNNLEIRFLSFTLERSVPKFLRSKETFKEDKSKCLLITKNSSDDTLKTRISQYIIQTLVDSGEFDEDQIKLLRSKQKT